ncbi:DNA polymerase III subunit alpha [Candidatus Parcubacteria bacterium]|nr:DNA polymerase III subunit alpha [Patescibacteria group bacterium]MBU4309146.1 DNA polymerase III subunit alpha [Patescibacteria group bacterium]MBU4432161.1 DNA polymerase III subunit alpha [Patescibacteria group bacterium]MBU4577507.1 DNA polymerase III subunit alpha [Patescibacteria group bacterium]MCG2697194.1 DNA polymerase III subunit alpha [Candidatus Parcubacteria bacterium]
MKFVHLHVHTHYSLLDGLTKLDELVDFVKKEGSPAVAITDHGVMYGVIEFYQKCKKAGIKPIIGVEAYLAPRSRHDKITRTDEKRNFHLILLAKNNQGYKNLLKLTSIAHLEGYYYKPRIDWEVLEKYHEGIIACTACIGGEIPTLIRSGNLEKARERALEYNTLFGQDNFYFELQHHPDLEGQDLVNQELIKISRELNIPLVATNDSHYLRKEDDEAQDILLCMQGKKKKEDTNRMCQLGNDFSFRSTADMIEDFKDTPDAIENTVKIADMCNVEIELGKVQLPHFDVPEGFDQASYLRRLCEDGLGKRYDKKYNEVSDAIRERMDYELSVVERMGWPSYFLIVADFVNWAKNQGIVVGPGRGSAAGSLICYLTGITNLDPLEYDLLFERFLNPDRVSMPDIDLDFADTRRGEVLEYVENKYGKDHVAQIITFGTMAARAAVKDVGRVLGAPYDYMDKLAKAIPMFTKLDEALRDVDEFKQMYKSDPQAKNIIDYARRLEGVSRHSSTHACGVLITKDPLVENVPVQYASSTDRSIVSQYSLHPVEDLGLLKMDFLGLKNLTIIESAIRIIKGTANVEIDIEKIPLDDVKTYKLFADGETTGVFQFESSGMKRYLRELRPTEFEDIIAMVALYRPGPMEWIPDYIAGKHGKTLTYLHPKLEPILKKTKGVAIYQEQVMQMARDLAGFTMAGADVLRKAMGKKIVKLLAEQKEKFIKGCVETNGMSEGLAEKIFSFIEPFAGYGFNRSHAACYAMIGYQTAYLKAHYPTEFMAALLTADQQHIERLAVEIEEAQRMGIIVSRPDVNQSFEKFTVVKSNFENGELVGKRKSGDMIRFGLGAVKNMGSHIASVLIDERKINGPYKDITDLLERVTDKDLNKKSLESLVKTGALDDFGERGMLLANVDNMLSYNKEMLKNQNSKQTSLFADVLDVGVRSMIRLNSAPAINKQEMLRWEKELLGLYVSDHPFSDYRKELEGIIVPLKRVPEFKDEDQMTVAGIITKIQKIITKTSKSMLFVKIEDDSGGAEVLVFPNLYKTTFSIWTEGKAVIIQGKKSDKDNEIKILANTAAAVSLRNIREVVAKFNSAEYGNKAKSSSHVINQDLRLIFNKTIDAGVLERLRDLFTKYKGENKVIFEIGLNGEKKVIETDFRVANSTFLLTEIRNKVGDAVVMR